MHRLGAWAATLISMAALSGCGEATLTIQLNQLPTENPFNGLAEIRVAVRVDGEEADSARVAFEGRPITLGPIHRAEGMHLLVSGFDQQSGATNLPSAVGESRPDLPDRGGACCVLVCFCLVETFDQNLCTCGSDTCEPQCSSP